jgi:hypothetical protein
MEAPPNKKSQSSAMNIFMRNRPVLEQQGDQSAHMKNRFLGKVSLLLLVLVVLSMTSVQMALSRNGVPTFFVQESLWSSMLLSVYDEKRQLEQQTEPPPNDPNVFVLMTEPRCIRSIPLVLNNSLTMLPPSFKVIFFHSHHNARCIQKWFNATPPLVEAVNSGRLLY